MKKISIKSHLISDDEINFIGKGILKENEIIFYEDKIKTKVKILEEKIIISREENYLLKMEFIRGKKTEATYNMYDKNFYLDIFTNDLKIEENKIFVNYDLTLDKNEKINFIYNLEYSIDS